MRISDWSSDVCSSDLLGLLLGIAGRHPHGHAVVPPLDLRDIVIALKKLAHERHAFLFHGKNDAIHKRSELAAIVQQARLPFAGFALAGIGLAAEIRITLQDVGAVRSEEPTAETQSTMDN